MQQRLCLEQKLIFSQACVTFILFPYNMLHGECQIKYDKILIYMKIFRMYLMRVISGKTILKTSVKICQNMYLQLNTKYVLVVVPGKHYQYTNVVTI